MNPKVDCFFEKNSKWKAEYAELRHIILGCEVKEELKWGCPCYTFQGKNVVLIHGFKNYCAILFHKGALIKDKKKILIQQTPNVQAARQLRFTNMDEIIKIEPEITAYIKQAIEIEKQGLKVQLKETKDFEMAAELKSTLKTYPEFKKAFYALAPGCQRAYILYFSSAKQSKTRIARIEKYIPKILQGKKMDDK